MRRLASALFTVRLAALVALSSRLSFLHFGCFQKRAFRLVFMPSLGVDGRLNRRFWRNFAQRLLAVFSGLVFNPLLRGLKRDPIDGF